MRAGNAFVDFIVMSVIYFIFVVISSMNKKKVGLIAHPNVYDLLTLNNIADGNKSTWMKSNYFLKNIDILIDEKPRRMLTYLTLTIMFETFIIYSILK